MPNTRAPRAQNGIGKDWTIVKLNSMKIPIGLDIDEFAKQVRSARGGERERAFTRVDHTSRLFCCGLADRRRQSERGGLHDVLPAAELRSVGRLHNLHTGLAVRGCARPSGADTRVKATRPIARVGPRWSADAS